MLHSRLHQRQALQPHPLPANFTVGGGEMSARVVAVQPGALRGAGSSPVRAPHRIEHNLRHILAGITEPSVCSADVNDQRAGLVCVGGDTQACEGRGAEKVGAHTRGNAPPQNIFEATHEE